MTLGLAIAPQDGAGVVLLSDSMGVTADWDPVAGSGHQLPGARKAGFCGKSRIAFVVSGLIRSDLDQLGEQVRIEGFEPATWALYRAAADSYAEACYTTSPRHTAGRLPDLLTAGGAPGQRPRIAMIAPSLDRSAFSEGPAMLAVGSWVKFWLEPLKWLEVPVPATLEEARAFALELARRVMSRCLRRGTVPFGPPFSIAIITAGDVTFDEFSE